MMTPEIAVNIATLIGVLAGMVYVARVVRTSGADHFSDDGRVRRLVATAPYHRLDNVLAKRR